MKKIPIGAYVLATKYSDGDPHDPWYVGFLGSIDGDRYMIVDCNGTNHRPSGYREIKTITMDEGLELIRDKDKYINVSMWKVLKFIRDDAKLFATLDAKEVK